MSYSSNIRKDKRVNRDDVKSIVEELNVLLNS